MAISDYLMTRLAAAQNARQLALQLEQAKAAREAASQRATTGYIQQLLEAGSRIPGGIADIAEAQSQAALQEAVTGLTAGELAGEKPAVPSAVPSAAEPVAGPIAEQIAKAEAAAKAGITKRGGPSQDVEGQLPLTEGITYEQMEKDSAEQDKRIKAAAEKLFGEEPTPSYLKPLTGGEPTKTMAPPPATAKEKLLETALKPAQRAGLDPNDPATREKLIAFGLSPEDVDWYLSGAPAAGSYEKAKQAATSVTGKMDLASVKPLETPEAGVVNVVPPSQIPTPAGLKAGKLLLGELPEAPKMEAAKAQPTAAEIKALTSRGKAGPVGPGVESDIEVSEDAAAYRKRLLNSGMPSAEVEKLVKERFKGRKGETISIDQEGNVIEQEQIKYMGAGRDESMRDETVESATPKVAAADKTPSEKELEAIPEVKEVEDPIEKAQLAFNKRIQEWKPPTYKQDIDAAAEKIVDDVWKNQPQGNPILNILSFGQYNNKLETARRTAKKLVAGEIRNLRKKDEETSYERFIQNAKLEAQQIAILQKDTNEKRKAQLKVSMTSLDPNKAIERLQGFDEVDKALNDIFNAGKTLISTGKQFPGGAQNAIELAKKLAIAATPDTTTYANQLNASLKALGASGGITVGPDMTKSDLLKQAVAQLQSASMSDEAKEFTTKTLSAIQMISKAREGGRVTDSDLKFYLNNLIIQDATKPSTMLKSINYLKEVNARSQNSWNKIFNKLYGETYGDMFPDLSGGGFTPEELAIADQLGWYSLTPESIGALSRVGARPGPSSIAQQNLSSAKETAKGVVNKILGNKPARRTTGAP